MIQNQAEREIPSGSIYFCTHLAIPREVTGAYLCNRVVAPTLSLALLHIVLMKEQTRPLFLPNRELKPAFTVLDPFI